MAADKQESDVYAAAEDAFIRKTLGIRADLPLERFPIGKGGSDRSYFRIVAAGHPQTILMRYGDMYEENAVYVSVAAFLRGKGIAVPTIHGHDPVRKLVLMEYLGDVDLYALRDEPWERRGPLYQKTLELAAKMHAFPLDQLPPRLFLMDGYDEKLYQWERNYFFDNFVRNVCRLEDGRQEENAIDEELAGLAMRLMEDKTVLIHRDLQSQNVMIREEMPVIIDFQGMRPGCLFYDLGSLLYDPYVSFLAEERESLLHFYYETVRNDYSWERFRSLFFQASAQRLMQALGAYGFLGMKRGKTYFLSHIPRALHNLVEVSRESRVFPALNDLAQRCLRVVAG